MISNAFSSSAKYPQRRKTFHDLVASHLSYTTECRYWQGSLGIVLFSIVALAGASGYFAAPSIGRQMGELTDRLPRSIERVEEQIKSQPWGDDY